MKSKEKKNYNPAIDVMRILAILAVILIHTTTRSLETVGYDLVNNQLTLFFNQAARFAVPMFFTISGFVLKMSSGSSMAFGEYLKKRVAKIFVPYLFWSFMYYFFVYKDHKISFWSALITGDASYQLYFIPTLVIFYAMFPALNQISSLVSKRGGLILLGIVQMAILAYDYFVEPLPVFAPVRIGLLNYYFLIVGLAAGGNQKKLVEVVKKWWLLITLGAGGLAVWIYFEGFRRYYATNNYLAFYSQWRPSIMIYSILLSGITYYAGTLLGRHQEVIKKLASLTFGVFFIHVIILEALGSMLGLHKGLSLFGLTAGLSFGLIYLAHKIPNGEKLIG